MSPPADPLAVPCPHCPAAISEACVNPKGDELERPHAKRIRAAELQADAQRRRAEAGVPKSITAERWRRVYVACRMELENAGGWTQLAAEQLEAMVLQMEEAAECREAVRGSRTVTGSTGQTVANPLGAAGGRAAGEALALAKALKLTPDTRGTRGSTGDVVTDGDTPGASGESSPGADDFGELDELAAARRRKAGAGGRRRK